MNTMSTAVPSAEARLLDQAVLADAALEAINQYGHTEFAKDILDHAETPAEQA